MDVAGEWRGLVIDVHAHLFFDELLGLAGSAGPSIVRGPGGIQLVTGGHRWNLGENSRLTLEPGRRVDALDEALIDKQVLSLSPLWLFHHSPLEVAEPFLQRANHLMADLCASYPERLLGLAALPAQDTSAAIAVLEHAVRTQGLVGGYIGMDARTGLDDPDLDDLYQACIDLDVPLFLHSTVAGVDGPPGDPRLDRWLGQVTLGYPIEETLAVEAIVLGGVLERHPRLDIVLPHGGGAFPMLRGRLRDWIRNSPDAPVTPDQFDSAVARLWFDTHVHSADALVLLQATASADRLMFGSNFGGWDSGSSDEVASIATQLDANAARLLRLDRAGSSSFSHHGHQIAP